mmetsp:Transcript_6243/g.9711  ORF Transcript_6243/g.9711 Transcript_6243/m.9711 type:complete len:1165 (-) Transcript_6243:426-3920(-)
MSQLRRSTRERRPVKVVTEKDFGEWAETSDQEEVSEEEEAGWTKKISKAAKAVGSQSGKRGRGRQRGSATKRPRVEEEEEDEEEDEEKHEPISASRTRGTGRRPPACALFEKVRKSGQAVKTAAADWLDSYKENNSLALSEMVTFLVRACGAPSTITEDDINEKDKEAVVNEVVENSNQEALSYPIVSKNPNLKKFKSRYVEFFRKLISTMKTDEDGILYDERLLSTVIEWMTNLSCASIRSFRHTITLGAMELVNALLDVALEEDKVLSVSSKSLAAEENKKKGPNKAKIKQFQLDISECEGKIKHLKELMDEIFSHVFVHRYRDVDGPIRSLCLESLGGWMLKFPRLFLQDSYLKYIGWCLNDKVVECRKAALESVLHVYEKNDEDSVKAMELFTQRFLKRFLELTQDTDVKVAATAINLMTGLLRSDVLGEDDGDKIPSLIWSNDEPIRQAAVEFVFEDTFSVEEGEDAKDEDSPEKMTEDLVQLLNIYDTCRPGQDMELPRESTEVFLDYLVDGFWDYLPVLQNWDVMYDHLMSSEKKSNKTDVPNDPRQTLIVYVMVACAKKATFAGSDQKKLSKKQQQDMESQTEAMGTFFVKHVTDMFKTFQADPHKVLGIASIVRCMDLNQFNLMRQSKVFKSMVKDFCGAFQKLQDENELADMARTLRHLACSDHELKDTAMTTVRETVSQLLDKFKGLGKEQKKNKSTDLVICLDRIVALFQQFSELVVYSDTCGELFQRKIAEGKDSATIQLLLQWGNLCCLAENLPEEPDVDCCQNTFARLVGQVEQVLDSSLDVSAKTVAFKVATDLIVQFKPGSKVTQRLPADVKQLFEQHCEALLHGTWAVDREGDQEELAAEAESLRTEAIICASKAVCADKAEFHTLAGMVFAGLPQYTKENGDLLKSVMHRYKQDDLQSLLDLQLAGLTQAYVWYEEKDVVDLAKKLLMQHSFLSRADNQERFVFFINGGINFGLGNPSSFGFLEPALTPFLKKCTKRDLEAVWEHWQNCESQIRSKKKEILGSVDDDEGEEAWSKFELFCTSITQACAPVAGSSRQRRRPAADLVDEDDELAAAGVDSPGKDNHDLDFKHVADDIEDDGSPHRSKQGSAQKRKSGSQQEFSQGSANKKTKMSMVDSDNEEESVAAKKQSKSKPARRGTRASSRTR